MVLKGCSTKVRNLSAYAQLVPQTIDGRNVPKIRTDMNFCTCYGFSVRTFIGTVRDTDFGLDLNLVRYEVRILVRENPNWNDFFSERYLVRKKFRKIEKKYRVQFLVSNSVSRTVPNKIRIKILTSYRTR